MKLAYRKPYVSREDRTLWVQDCVLRAREILAAPPARPHLQRVEPVGDLVAHFVLPLSLIQSSNPSRRKQNWQHAKTKAALQVLMRSQFVPRSEPLPGRPMVRCIRFSSFEPDRYADTFKVAVDRLVDLKLIEDDKPALCDLHQLWEYAPPKQGFGLIEVFTGAA